MRSLLLRVSPYLLFFAFSANADECQLSDKELVSLQQYASINKKNHKLTCYEKGEIVNNKTNTQRYLQEQDKITSAFEVGDSLLRYSIVYNGRIYIDDEHLLPAKSVSLSVLYSNNEGIHKVLKSELTPLTGFFIRSRLNTDFSIKAKGNYQRIETIWILVKDTSHYPNFSIQKITDSALHIRYQ